MGVFHFKHFDIDDHGCGMKICSDSVLLAAWFLPPYRDALTVADIGTGSGVLALLAADIMPKAQIVAIEKNNAAASAARRNFKDSPWSDRLCVVNEDFLDYTIDGGEESFDIVICNPPYFANGAHAADPARAQARHQESLTYSTVMTFNRLKYGGHLGLVSPAEYEHDIIYEAELLRLKLRRICRVVTSPGKAPSRLLWDFSTADGPLSDTTLELRGYNNKYTDAYRRLVEPFYMKL